MFSLEYGKKAGFDAIKAFNNIPDYFDAPASVSHGDIKIPYIPLMSKKEAERNLAELAMRTLYPIPANTDDYQVMQNLAILRENALS